MNWIKLNKNTKLPSNKVICLDNKTHDVMVGYINYNDKTQKWETDNGVIVINVTHFCKIEYPKK